jgi:FdhD protein
VCGSTTVDDLCARLAPVAVHGVAVDLAVLANAVDGLRSQQALFSSTGSVHGAGAFSLLDGSVSLVREDVGRHNAVDKVAGRLLLDEALPAHGLGLVLSGRVSVELVQKAWSAGFGVVAAVGGPSSLAIDTAAAGGITLAAFVRDGRATVYTGTVTA